MFWFRYCQKLKKSRDGICRLLEQFDKISGKLRCLNYFSNALCVNSCVMNIENIVYHCWLFTGIQETWEKRSTRKEALSTVTNRFELQEVQIKRKWLDKFLSLHNSHCSHSGMVFKILLNLWFFYSMTETNECCKTKEERIPIW